MKNDVHKCRIEYIQSTLCSRNGSNGEGLPLDSWVRILDLIKRMNQDLLHELRKDAFKSQSRVAEDCHWLREAIRWQKEIFPQS